MDWVIRTAIPDDSRGFILERKRSSRYPEKRLSILAYADDLVLLASEELAAQEMMNDLVATASRVGLQVNVRKTETMSIPTNASLSISCINSGGNPLPLTICKSFIYLGGQVPDSHDDFLRRRALAWAAMNKLRLIWASPNLTDILRGKLFEALIETILLYNAETWTTSDSFLSTLDAAHSSLLRAAFNIHWPEHISNGEIYKRANLTKPSTTLRVKKLRLVGHLIRSEAYSNEPIHKVLLWQSTSTMRKGQGRRTTLLNQVFVDAGIHHTNHGKAVSQLRQLAKERKI